MYRITGHYPVFSLTVVVPQIEVCLRYKDVVLGPRAVQLGVELAGAADLLRVRPFTLDLSEQRLGPGLILRRVGAAQGES